MEKYETIKDIASGSFGSIIKAKSRANQSIHAIKTFHASQTNESGISTAVVREVIFSSNLNHPNIMSSQETLFENEKFHIVMPFCDDSLFTFLRSNIAFDIVDFSHQLLLGVNYLHENSIMHRDLKPENILVENSNTLKITDFGFAIFIPQQKMKLEGLSTFMFSSYFRPPEVLLGETNYEYSADMWSVGAILFEMITRTSLLKKDTDKGQLLEMFDLLGTPTEASWQGVDNLVYFPLYKNHQSAFPKAWQKGAMGGFPLPEDINPDLKDIMLNLLVLNPKKRFTAKQCLSHALFKKYNEHKESLPMQIHFPGTHPNLTFKMSESNQKITLEWMKDVQLGEHLRVDNRATTLWLQILNTTSEISLKNAQLWAIVCIWVMSKLSQDNIFSSLYASQCTGYTCNSEAINQCEFQLLRLLGLNY